MKHILFAFVLLGSSFTWACQCFEGSTDPDAAYEKSSSVVLVTVEESRLEARSHTVYGKNDQTGEWEEQIETEREVVASAKVEEVLKGDPPEEILLEAGHPNSNCHIPIAVGRTYLAFVDEEGKAHVGYCSATKEPRHIDLKFLRKHLWEESNKTSQGDA